MITYTDNVENKFGSLNIEQNMGLFLTELRALRDFIGNRSIVPSLLGGCGVFRSIRSSTQDSMYVQPGPSPSSFNINTGLIVDINNQYIWNKGTEDISIPLSLNPSGTVFFVGVRYLKENFETGTVNVVRQGSGEQAQVIVERNPDAKDFRTLFRDFSNGYKQNKIFLQYPTSEQSVCDIQSISSNGDYLYLSDNSLPASNNVKFSVVSSFSQGLIPAGSNAYTYNYDRFEILYGTSPSDFDEQTSFLLAQITSKGSQYRLDPSDIVDMRRTWYGDEIFRTRDVFQKLNAWTNPIVTGNIIINNTVRSRINSFNFVELEGKFGSAMAQPDESKIFEFNFTLDPNRELVLHIVGSRDATSIDDVTAVSTQQFDVPIPSLNVPPVTIPLAGQTVSNPQISVTIPDLPINAATTTASSNPIVNIGLTSIPILIPALDVDTANAKTVATYTQLQNDTQITLPLDTVSIPIPAATTNAQTITTQPSVGTINLDVDVPTHQTDAVTVQSTTDAYDIMNTIVYLKDNGLYVKNFKPGWTYWITPVMFSLT